MKFLDPLLAVLISISTNPIDEATALLGMKVDPKVACLTQNIYHEARNESTAGMLAVANVTLNRVKSNAFPNTICEVVYEAPHYITQQKGIYFPYRHRCQFSWYCDGKSDEIKNMKKYVEIYILAEQAMQSKFDVTDGALFYHADYVDPDWNKSMTITAKIDAHIFYKPRN
jgi:spore germination cell wall hydrolase CwlJ-like protein